MNSMTGYAFKEVMAGSALISVEIKSVNSRFLDLNINVPPFLNPVESRIRRLVCGKVARGKVDVTVRSHDTESAATVTADPLAARQYFEAIGSVASAIGKNAEDIPLSLIIAQDGVLNVTRRYDAESCWEKIEPVFNEVLDSFIADRKREGVALSEDLLRNLDILDRCGAFFKEWQPQMEDRFRESVAARFSELLGEHADQNRIMQETAAMLVKYTVNEEIIRLHSHLAALRKEIEENPVPGKRIDFICQEANREINTIGSKSQFTEISAMVITAKDALENIREQGRNVE